MEQNTKQNQQPISIAYSPDTDDAFMVQAMKAHRVPCGPYQFSYYSADIQELNEKAQQEIFDVTAISIAVYPSISEQYYLMPIGASIGDNFGPAVVVKSGSSFSKIEDLNLKKVAVPGKLTSAYFAAVKLLPTFEPVFLPFHEIGKAIMDGKVDAGILIHELQLNYQEFGLDKIADLGQLWYERFNLPLPLGANAIKRSLGEKVIQEVSNIMSASIRCGLEKREQTLKEALQSSKAVIDLPTGDRYISMYVNERSLRMASDVRESITLLINFGSEAGLCQQINVDDCLLS